MSARHSIAHFHGISYVYVMVERVMQESFDRGKFDYCNTLRDKVCCMSLPAETVYGCNARMDQDMGCVIFNNREVPDSRWPVLRYEYRYRPVLRVAILTIRKWPPSTDRGRWQHKRRLCVLCLTNTSARACQTWIPTLPLAEDMALGRPASQYRYRLVFVTINTSTGRKKSYRHTSI